MSINSCPSSYIYKYWTINTAHGGTTRALSPRGWAAPNSCFFPPYLCLVFLILMVSWLQTFSPGPSTQQVSMLLSFYLQGLGHNREVLKTHWLHCFWLNLTISHSIGNSSYLILLTMPLLFLAWSLKHNKWRLISSNNGLWGTLDLCKADLSSISTWFPKTARSAESRVILSAELRVIPEYCQVGTKQNQKQIKCEQNLSIWETFHFT